jgi:hypothetical protein
VKASLHPKYAADVKVCSSTNVVETDLNQTYYTSVEIRIMPEHTGHSPEDDTNLNIEMLDSRVRDYIQERAKDIMLPISCIASDVHAFCEKLTANLDVSKDNRRFFPTEQSIARIVR